MNSIQKKQIKRLKRPKFKVAQTIPKRVICPLCFKDYAVEMTHDPTTNTYRCPRCGHESAPKLSQITLTTSTLKASNDPRERRRAFLSKEANQKRRIAKPSVNIRGEQVYQSLAEADAATNIDYKSAEERGEWQLP